MVLDPLSAFSVACNVLQIVETSLRVLGKTAECYKGGAPDEVSIIIGNLHTIEGLNNELQDVIPGPPGKSTLSSAELRLVEANEECLRLSGDFIRLLDSLKITKRSVWHSIGSSIKTMWYQDKLASFAKAVSESRANLTLAFLLLMHERSLMMQNSVVTATADVEHRILEAVKGHAGSLEAEIGRLTSCLNELSFEDHKASVGHFSLAYQTQLVQLSEQLAKIWEHQRARDETSASLEASRNGASAQHRLLQSLRYPQMQERKEEISIAYRNTYEWLFQDDPREQNNWHNFVPWARRADNPHSIYWIHGKPGSGKSTLARFIYDRLDVRNHLCPWAKSRIVVKAAHFFWNPGTTLQKSWAGMLRSLLFQLLDQAPGLSQQCVSPSRWRTALSPDAILDEWTESELLHGMRVFIRTTEAYLFFLIDGLDELQGNDERKEQIVDFILDLASFNNVKLCVASRPDNIFRDAFHGHPDLKLETLTHNDIQTYVTERFAKERRIQTLSRGDPEIMNDLVAFLVRTACGVFLWVRLVIHELLRAARDGATFAELVIKAHEIPCDLDSYFARFIDSIPPEYRQEAAQLFQITLHSEDSFIALHGLRLLDLSYLGAFQGTLGPHIRSGFPAFDKNNVAELELKLDATARRINSRCRGLIECYYAEAHTEYLIDYPELSGPSQTDGDTLHTTSSYSGGTFALLRASNRHVGLMHRSLRDFLTSPKMLQKLQDYSCGSFNTRLFLCRARLAQIQSLDYEGNDIHAQLALGLSSYVLSALSTADLKYSEESTVIAAQLSPVVESLGVYRTQEADQQAWYLCKSFREFQTAVPDFLGVAIDFDLVAYLRKKLTVEAIHDKRGPSVLECILIGRFSDFKIMIGNRFPNIEVLRLALRLGANPNEDCHGVSVWAAFIRHLNTLAIRHLRNLATRGPVPADAQKARIEAIRVLLEHGADPELPSSCLAPGPLIPRWNSRRIPVVAVLRSMVGLYTLARQELQECIDLADDKVIQALRYH